MYHVEWILEKRIILMCGVGDQTIETIEDGIKRLHELYNKGNAPVHMVSDSRHVKRFPVDLSSMKKLMARNEHSGLTVVVGGDGVSKFITKLMVTFSGNAQPMYVNTIPEAITKLISLDDTLPKHINYTEPDYMRKTSQTK